MAQKYFLHWFVSTLCTVHQQPLWLSNPCGVWWLWLWAYYKGRNPQAENRQWNGCGCWFHSRPAADDEEEAIPGELTEKTKVRLITWIYPGRGGLAGEVLKGRCWLWHCHDCLWCCSNSASSRCGRWYWPSSAAASSLWSDSHNPIYLQTSSKTISIPVFQTSLDPTLSQSILFTHAGCDTTSRPYGIEKLSAIAKHQALAIHADTFLTSDQSRDTIEGAGHQALAVLYGCQDLNHGQLSKFREKVITSSFYVFHPQLMLPASTAGGYTFKCNHGWGMTWSQLTGDGYSRTTYWNHVGWNRPLLQHLCSKWSDAAALVVAQETFVPVGSMVWRVQ